MIGFLERMKWAIYRHYQDTTFIRTERQLELEQWLIPRVIPFSRYMLMPASVLIQVGPDSRLVMIYGGKTTASCMAR